MQKEDVSQNRLSQTEGSKHIHLSELAGELVDQTAPAPARHNDLESPGGDSGAVSSLPRRISSSGLVYESLPTRFLSVGLQRCGPAPHLSHPWNRGPIR